MSGVALESGTIESSTWTTSGTVTVGSDALTIANGGRATCDPGVVDYTVEARFTTITDQNLITRFVDANNYYQAGKTDLYRVEAGVFTSIARWGQVPDGTVMALTVRGHSLTVTGDGVLLGSAIDDRFGSVTVAGLRSGANGGSR